MADSHGTQRRVVVTGLGATTSPIGGDLPSTWSAALEGRSGARPIDGGLGASSTSMPVTFAAQLAVPTSDTLSRVETRRLDPSGQMAMVAAREAWADAGSPEVEPERLGVVVASGIGGVWTLLSAYDVLKEKGPRRVFPLTVPMLMPNGPAAAIGIEIGARAGVHTPVSRLRVGRRGHGLRPRHDPLRSSRRRARRAAPRPRSTRCRSPGSPRCRRCRRATTHPRPPPGRTTPARDGFVLGEGAALAVLESEEHARARGATIYAEVVAVGITSDAHHIAAPDPTGAGRDPRDGRGPGRGRARRRDDVVHLNAHATSTPVGDVAEAKAIRNALGDATDRRRGLGDEVDDRAPARRRRRAGGGVHDPRRARPGGAADDQRRRPRP